LAYALPEHHVFPANIQIPYFPFIHRCEQMSVNDFRVDIAGAASATDFSIDNIQI